MDFEKNRDRTFFHVTAEFSEIINMERQNISPTVYHLLQHYTVHICFCRKKLFHVEKTVGEGQKF